MNLRMKLIFGAVMVVIITIVFSTFGVSYLVRKQNDENGKGQVSRAVQFTTRVLEDMQTLRIKRISDFTSNPTNVINFRYLLEIKKRKESSAYKFILEQPKEEMLSALLAMVRDGNFDGIHAYDGDGDLLIYLDQMGNYIEIGLITTNSRGSIVAKYQKVTESGNIGTNWQEKPFKTVAEARSGLPFPNHPESDFGAIRGRLALTGIAPVINTDLYLETKKKKIGCVKFYKFLGQDFAGNLARGTEMDVSIFTGGELTAGTLNITHELPAGALARIKEKQDEKTLPQPVGVVSLEKGEYYQAAVPIYLKDDYIGAIVLSLSRYDTLRKTRENIILLLLIMGVCMVVVIPGAIFISGKLSNRIRSILAVVREITGGDLSARIKAPANDELGVLARSFDQMAEDLQKTMKELEEKIRERDKEITERKRAEEALNNSKRQLADVINLLPDAT